MFSSFKCGKEKKLYDGFLTLFDSARYMHKGIRMLVVLFTLGHFKKWAQRNDRILKSILHLIEMNAFMQVQTFIQQVQFSRKKGQFFNPFNQFDVS